MERGEPDIAALRHACNRRVVERFAWKLAITLAFVMIEAAIGIPFGKALYGSSRARRC